MVDHVRRNVSDASFDMLIFIKNGQIFSKIAAVAVSNIGISGIECVTACLLNFMARLLIAGVQFDAMSVRVGKRRKSMVELNHRCDTCAVRHRSVCSALTRPEIERLNGMAHSKLLPPGQIILRDNERPGYFANIISGVVKLTKSLGDGRQQIVGLQFASDFLGRPFRDSSPYNAEAVTDVQLCTFETSQFEKLAKEFRGLEHRLFEHTLDELDAAQEWMLLLGRKSAEEKVASFLLMVARRMNSVGCSIASGPVRFELPLARAEIADFLGLTIETVSRQFTKLKVDKFISLDGNRTITVHDIDRLHAIAERNDD